MYPQQILQRHPNEWQHTETTETRNRTKTVTVIAARSAAAKDFVIEAVGKMERVTTATLILLIVMDIYMFLTCTLLMVLRGMKETLLEYMDVNLPIVNER